MTIASTVLITLLLSANLTACSAPGPTKPINSPPTVTPQPQNSLVGEYQYSGFDDKGIKITEGRLTVASVEPRRVGNETQTQIKGSWELREVVHRDQIGKQAGKGELIGGIVDGEIILDLNPNISDANVILKGKLDGNRLRGTWSFNGYAGPLSKGTFEAVKK
jgi:hypothetical protein